MSIQVFFLSEFDLKKIIYVELKKCFTEYIQNNISKEEYYLKVFFTLIIQVCFGKCSEKEKILKDIFFQT